MSSSHPVEIPRWIDLVLLPLFNLALAFAVSAGVLLAIGQSPSQVLALLVKGAFGSAGATLSKHASARSSAMSS